MTSGKARESVPHAADPTLATRYGQEPRHSAEPGGVAGTPARLPASVLEIRVTGKRIDINELYSHTEAARLLMRLEALGVNVRQVFNSWCG